MNEYMDGRNGKKWISFPSHWLCGLACLLAAAVVPGQAKIIVAAADGSASASGAANQPTTLAAAILVSAPGDTIQLKGGVYALNAQVTLERTAGGTAGKMKCLFAAAGEKPVLDFSTEPYAAASNPRGLQIDGSYWHVRGLEVKGSADNGIYVAGSHNIVEGCVTHKNRDTGLQIGRWKADAPNTEWPSDNLILNCESYDNYDAPPGSGENADGFACKLTAGSGNVFLGCVSHNNIDDGWDLFTKPETGPIGTVVLDQCISYSNGTLTDGTTNANGDRNGFKLGGDKIAVAHVVTRCVAFSNGKNGFTWNSNPGAIRVSNNLAFDNVEGNFNFGTNSVATEAVFTNNISFWTQPANAQSDKHIGTDVANSNCWWDKSKTPSSVNGKGLVATASDFAASLAAIKITRRADGNLIFDPFRLAAGSKLANAGAVPAGALPFDAAKYYQGAPDMGAVETGAPTGLTQGPGSGMYTVPTALHAGTMGFGGARIWLAPWGSYHDLRAVNGSRKGNLSEFHP